MFKILGTLKKQKRKLEFECTAERRLFVKFYKHIKKKKRDGTERLSGRTLNSYAFYGILSN